MFGQNREELRRFFQVSWEKRRNDQALQPLEHLVAQVIEQHPEYHRHLDGPDQLDRDFGPEQGETNPWLHMGMHITLAEQLSTDRPSGIRDLHKQITRQHGDAHAAEHQMMECLGLVLWEASRQNRAPDETAYLDYLKKLLK